MRISYTGIDILSNNDSSCLISSMEDFDTDIKFDVIVFSHVLEHLKSPYNCLKKAKSLLNPKGRIIIIVPNVYTFKFLQVLPFNLKNYPKVNDTHFQEFTKSEIYNLCNSLDLHIQDFFSQGFEFVLFNLPNFFQKCLSWLFPLMSEELCFVVSKDLNLCVHDWRFIEFSNSFIKQCSNCHEVRHFSPEYDMVNNISN